MDEYLKVLVIGGGGREHALAWKLAQSARVARVWVAPGNGGTAGAGKIDNLALAENDFDGLIDFARREGIGLTFIGPEAPLAGGVVDAFQAAGLRCFGPTRAAAQLEASKAFAKAFMARHNIPTARYDTFTSLDAALTHLQQVDYPVVIKASGLAAGKGVIVPDSAEEAEAALRHMMAERAFGAAGDTVVIEERLFGQEASVLAFADGRHLAVMPPAQDHKQIFEGDRGPNTGGMGAYAPAPLITPSLLETIKQTVLQPALDGLRSEGTPYAGILYAGLMMTQAELKVLEFNCRFGDPETQVILPLLETDLVDVVEAALDGQLDRMTLKWKSGSAATVVAASEGYPGSYPKGREISGLDGVAALKDVVVFHAGTQQGEDDRLFTGGGRVLAVTGSGDNLAQALNHAYAGLEKIDFRGMYFRRDIGAKA
jgi:phosphoribosylamine--glycine ligase